MTRILGYMQMTGGTIWVSPRQVAEGVVGLTGTGREFLPLDGGVLCDDVDGISRKEFSDYLACGYGYEGLMELGCDSDGRLCLVAATSMRPIVGHPAEPRVTPEEQAIFQEMESAALRIGSAFFLKGADANFSLEDWQVAGSDATGLDPSIARSVDLTIKSSARGLQISAPDGREIALELEDGALRVHAYDDRDGRDNPVNISIAVGKDIEVDTEGYFNDCRWPDVP